MIRKSDWNSGRGKNPSAKTSRFFLFLKSEEPNQPNEARDKLPLFGTILLTLAMIPTREQDEASAKREMAVHLIYRVPKSEIAYMAYKTFLEIRRNHLIRKTWENAKI